MTDADATMMPGAVNRIQKMVLRPTIGAVGGTPNRTGDLFLRRHIAICTHSFNWRIISR